MSAQTPTHAYLLSFDNGQEWEDHYRYPLWLVSTRKRADAIVAEVETWLEEQQSGVPENPLYVEGIDDAEYARLADVRDDYINALKPPYDLTDLLDNFRYGWSGHLVVGELEYLHT